MPPGTDRAGPCRSRPDPSDLAAEAMRCGQDLLLSGNPAEARRWLDRASRLAPNDAILDFLLATALLRLNDTAALPRLRRLAAAHDVREIWAALASAAWQGGDAAAAAAAMANALARHALAPSVATLASRIAATAGFPGWCGLDSAGRLHIQGPGQATVLLDGQGIAPAGPGVHALPAGWRNAQQLAVHGGTGPFLGSPIDIAAIRRLEGCIVTENGGATGWAWHPADPDRDPRLILRGVDGRAIAFVATAPASVRHPAPLARPRLIHLPADALAPLGGRIAVVGEDGAELPGSPLAPAAAMLTPGDPPKQARPPHGLVLALGGQDVPDSARFDAALAALPRFRAHTAADMAAGLRRFDGHDLLWLQALPTVPDWLATLRAAAYASPDTGSVAALAVASPGPEVPTAGAPIPVAAQAPGCVFFRHDCLVAAGGLRPDMAAPDGAIAEICRRTGQAGWRHVVVPDVVVPMTGPDQAPIAQTLRQHDLDLLRRQYVIDEASSDALTAARRKVAAWRWQQGGGDASAILITHDAGGGIARVVASRAAALRAGGLRPVVLRPVPEGCVVGEGGGPDFPELRFRLPGELAELAALLAAGRPQLIELHHLLGHRHAILGLARLLDVPLDIFVHDYAAFCPRIALVGAEGRYCGEPDIAGCITCIAAAGSNLEEEIGPAELRARSAADLAGARRIVAPSADAARRLQRHFPAIRPEVVPWEDDATFPPRRSPAPAGRPRVCVIGAIGVEKGFDVLLATVRAATVRHPDLEFVIVGHTIDDRTLMAAGNVFVTGAYRDGELPDLVMAQQATIAFLPSIWPETWCFTLSHAWRAGLDAVVFDIGAPADRVRQTGRGVVLPLGLPAAGIANVLVTAATLARETAPTHHRPERNAGRAMPAETNRSKNA